jgi:DNA-binding XRE family transcriptional regulator
MMNNLKKARESLLISKSELARKAGVSLLTIIRVEKGQPCRTETKRKILSGLGFKPSERDAVFSSNHPPDGDWSITQPSNRALKNKNVDRAAY